MTERTFDSPCLSAFLDEFKSHLRVTSHDLDSELREKLLASVASAEHHIGTVIIRSDFVKDADYSNTVRLKAPVLSVGSIEVDGNTIPADKWQLKGRTLSIDSSVTGNKVKVSYSAGLSQIPYDMKAAIFMHGATLFNNPTDSVETLTKASNNLLRPYRTYGIDGEQD